MDSATRRTFLLRSGVVAASALAAGASGFTLSQILETAGEAPPESSARILVLITLYGGNDGLNTVVPFGDKAYRAARPDLSYEADQILKLDKTTGLNPKMTGLHKLYGEQKLAIVRGVGYPKPDRSHFRSMDIWQTGQPAEPGTTGWLGRWLDAAGGDPRLAVSFEPVLPPLLAGATSAGAAVGGNGLRLPKGVGLKTIAALAKTFPGESPLMARAAGCFADAVNVEQMMREVKEAAEKAENGPDAATGTGGNTALEQQLELVAQCVEAKVATRAFSVSLGGFDTHANEKRLQEVLLGQLDRAVSNFVNRMARSEQGRKVVVAIYSEFGRRVKANASDGTDHGTASNVFLIGAGVTGGLYGDPPSLTKLDQGDLKYTTDFRDVYATLLDRVLQADPAQLLFGWKGRLKSLH